MANYAKGAAFEREFIEMMEHKGYLGFRMAGSHSPVDVILIRELEPKEAVRDVPVALCQLKRYKHSRPKPTQEFKELPNWHFIGKWWVTRKDRGPVIIERV